MFNNKFSVMRRIFTFVCALSLAAAAWGQEFSAVNEDGKTISYTVTGEGEVEVTRHPNSSGTEYEGDVRIPETVEHESVTYTVTGIGEEAFAYSDLLDAVEIPASVKAIGANAFQGTRLKEVEIPEGVTEIGTAAFNSCFNLETAVLPGSITEIDTLTFQYCYSLKEVNIPAGVRKINLGAFNYCLLLEEIEIPASVKEIESLAFAYCLSLREVRCHATDVPALGDVEEETGVFTTNYLVNLSFNYYDDTYGEIDFESFKHDGAKHATLRVPQASVEAYRAAEGWGTGVCHPEEEDMIYDSWGLSFGVDGEVCNYFHEIESLEGGGTATDGTEAEKGFGVYAENGVIYIEGETEGVEVYDITGRRVYTGNSTAVSVGRAGVYIVKSGEETEKVVVR